MLVHWNSYFNVANMENEVYSERSKSMHSLCSIFCSDDSSDQYTFYSYSAIFQQTLIETGRKRNFMDKVYHFDQFSVNSVIIGEVLDKL